MPAPEGFGDVWVERYTRGRDEGTNTGFAIVDAVSGDFVGFVALREARPRERGRPRRATSSRRTRAAAASRPGRSRLLTAWAFDEYPLERIELLIDAANPSSEVVAQRCGYAREGVLRWTYLKPGLRWDTIVYSRLRRERDA